MMKNEQQQQQDHQPQAVRLHVGQAEAVAFVRELMQAIQQEIDPMYAEAVGSMLTIQVQIRA